MVLPTLPGQVDLVLALGKPGLLFIGQRIDALVAAHTLLILGTLLVFLGDRPAAGMALVVFSALQPMVDRNPVIKYKALSFPKVIVLINFIEII